MAHLLVAHFANEPTVSLIMGMLVPFSIRFGIQLREKKNSLITSEDIAWSDSILIIRPYDVTATDIVKAAKKYGKSSIVYLDDDLLHIPDLHINMLRTIISKLLKKRNQAELQKCLSMCDILWGSSPVLVNKYRQYVKNGRCVRCDVTADITRMKQVDMETGYPHILFAGGSDHAELLNQYIIPAINKIADKYPKLQITCIGVTKVQIKPCKAHIKFIPWNNNYEEYRKTVDEGQYHIGIAVIKEDEFYKCKYYNKFIEYSLLGMMGIYTNCEPYTLIVQHGVNGLLADATVDSWAENIAFAIEHPQNCREYVYNAQNLIREKFEIGKLLDEIRIAMPEICEQHGSYSIKVTYHQRFIKNICAKMAMTVVEMYDKLISMVGRE